MQPLQMGFEDAMKNKRHKVLLQMVGGGGGHSYSGEGLVLLTLFPHPCLFSYHRCCDHSVRRFQGRTMRTSDRCGGGDFREEREYTDVAFESTIDTSRTKLYTHSKLHPSFIPAPLLLQMEVFVNSGTRSTTRNIVKVYR